MVLCAPGSRQELRDQVWLGVAWQIARLATCPKRQVGCVVVDKRGHVLATGYNGVPAGVPHCTDQPCPGVTAPSGQSLYTCEAIHAEANALIQCQKPWEVHTIYCTDSPCVSCVNMMLNTSASRVVFSREYPHPQSRDRWTRAGRLWVKTGDMM